MICPYDSPAWQLARSRPTNTALALYLIYVKSVLPHGWEGDNGCLSLCVIHSALELGGYGGKVTIYLRNGKGRGNVKWMVYKEVAIVAIVACRNCRNLIIRHDECINNYFIIL